MLTTTTTIFLLQPPLPFNSVNFFQVTLDTLIAPHFDTIRRRNAIERKGRWRRRARRSRINGDTRRSSHQSHERVSWGHNWTNPSVAAALRTRFLDRSSSENRENELYGPSHQEMVFRIRRDEGIPRTPRRDVSIRYMVVRTTIFT